MDQRTHSWIAVRAIALLDDEPAASRSAGLVSLLKPHTRKASVGAWIPDQVDAKRGGAGSCTDNHVLKMEPYQGTQVDRFVLRRADLLDRIGPYRLMGRFVQNAASLDDQWWGAPYKGDAPKAGQHLSNRIMALSTMMKDLLLLGDQEVDSLVPGAVRFLRYMDAEARTHEEAAAMYFFMLSHFTADACMPCHCDGRDLAAYAAGLHNKLETHWKRVVGCEFDKAKLLGDGDVDTALRQAKAVDTRSGLSFDNAPIPDLRPGQDPWLESVYLCRASFGVASVMAPYTQYPYDSPTLAPFDTVLGAGHQDLLSRVDQAVMHDAVLNTAVMWKHVWNKVSAE